MAVYNASKGAVEGLTRSVAVDHGGHGVRCVAVAPGWINTEMTEAALAQSENPTEAREQTIAAHPIGRFGTADDVAALVAWLASDDATFATGAVFTLDGGATAASPVRF